MIRTLVPLIALGCFCVLAAYANGRDTAKHPIHTVRQPITLELDMDDSAQTRGGYSQAERSGPVKLWKRVQRELDHREDAQTVARIYGITAGNVDSYKRWWK